MNLSTILIAAGLCAVVALIVRSMFRDKRSGKGCNGNCAGCSGCHH